MAIGDNISDSEISLAAPAHVDLRPLSGDEWTIRMMITNTTAANGPAVRWPNIADQTGRSMRGGNTSAATLYNLGTYTNMAMYLSNAEYFRIRNENSTHYFGYFAKKHKD